MEETKIEPHLRHRIAQRDRVLLRMQNWMKIGAALKAPSTHHRNIWGGIAPHRNKLRELLPFDIACGLIGLSSTCGMPLRIELGGVEQVGKLIVLNVIIVH